MSELSKLNDSLNDLLEQRELQVGMLEGFIQRLKEGLRDGIDPAKLNYLIDVALEKSREINESLEGK
jgi:hypothetical protein